jgi:uncharacterized protein YndB with AHSA1/START domain
MSEIHIVIQYPHPRELVWRALTDPAVVPQWTTTGRGGRPVGFSTAVGTRFQYVGKPMPGWNGIVHCEMLEAREPLLLRYSWRGGDDDEVTIVTNRLEPLEGGTRLTWDHTGFTGVGGFLMSKVLGSVRRKMLEVGLPRVLERLGDEGSHAPLTPPAE